ncbi:MAG: helix-turn-helix domain-containing protein, partial [Bacteroidales bacterium]|nr:helix-turn-helix domain-containing protein [Bacteroidales bacterium]
ITVAQFLSGKTITEICTHRNLSQTVVESHLLNALKLKQLSAKMVLADNKLEEIIRELRSNDYNINKVKIIFGDKYSFFDIRVAAAHI